MASDLVFYGDQNLQFDDMTVSSTDIKSSSRFDIQSQPLIRGEGSVVTNSRPGSKTIRMSGRISAKNSGRSLLDVTNDIDSGLARKDRLLKMMRSYTPLFSSNITDAVPSALDGVSNVVDDTAKYQFSRNSISFDTDSSSGTDNTDLVEVANNSFVTGTTLDNFVQKFDTNNNLIMGLHTFTVAATERLIANLYNPSSGQYEIRATLSQVVSQKMQGDIDIIYHPPTDRYVFTGSSTTTAGELSLFTGRKGESNQFDSQTEDLLLDVAIDSFAAATNLYEGTRLVYNEQDKVLIACWKDSTNVIQAKKVNIDSSGVVTLGTGASVGISSVDANSGWDVMYHNEENRFIAVASKDSSNRVNAIAFTVDDAGVTSSTLATLNSININGAVRVKYDPISKNVIFYGAHDVGPLNRYFLGFLSFSSDDGELQLNISNVPADYATQHGTQLSTSAILDNESGRLLISSTSVGSTNILVFELDGCDQQLNLLVEKNIATADSFGNLIVTQNDEIFLSSSAAANVVIEYRLDLMYENSATFTFASLDISPYYSNSGFYTFLYIPDSRNVDSIDISFNSAGGSLVKELVKTRHDGGELIEGWNLIGINLADTTEVGTFDNTSLISLTLTINFSNNTTVLQGFRLGGSIFVDEDETRNYKAYLSQVSRSEQHHNIESINYSLEFLAYEGVGRASFFNSVTSSENITDFGKRYVFDTGSTYDALPKFKLDIPRGGALGGIMRKIRFRHEQTNEEFYLVGTFYTGEVVEVDFENLKATLNGIDIAPEGSIFKLTPGINSIEICVNPKTGSSIVGYNLDLSYKSRYI